MSLDFIHGLRLKTKIARDMSLKEVGTILARGSFCTLAERSGGVLRPTMNVGLLWRQAGLLETPARLGARNLRYSIWGLLRYAA